MTARYRPERWLITPNTVVEMTARYFGMDSALLRIRPKDVGLRRARAIAAHLIDSEAAHCRARMADALRVAPSTFLGILDEAEEILGGHHGAGVQAEARAAVESVRTELVRLRSEEVKSRARRIRNFSERVALQT